MFRIKEKRTKFLPKTIRIHLISGQCALQSSHLSCKDLKCIAVCINKKLRGLLTKFYNPQPATLKCWTTCIICIATSMIRFCPLHIYATATEKKKRQFLGLLIDTYHISMGLCCPLTDSQSMAWLALQLVFGDAQLCQCVFSLSLFLSLSAVRRGCEDGFRVECGEKGRPQACVH